jgi:hypothetical protein
MDIVLLSVWRQLLSLLKYPKSFYDFYFRRLLEKSGGVHGKKDNCPATDLKDVDFLIAGYPLSFQIIRGDYPPAPFLIDQ